MESGAAAANKKLRELAVRARRAWALVSSWRKWELAGAAAIMLITSAGNTGVAVLLGQLIDRIQAGLQRNDAANELLLAAGKILGAICAIYLLREVLNVCRRYLVEEACTAINRDMQTQLVKHLLMLDLSVFSREMIGSLHGKVFRSVDGLVHFLRLMGLECVPALFTGLFALSVAVLKQPLLGFVMAGVIPLSLWLTLRQVASQQGVRVKLMRDCEEIDGIVVEQLNGSEYIRVADTLDAEIDRLSAATEKRRQREIWHHFQMSLFGCAKALNEGLFHVIVLGLATYLAIHHQISFGDILTFSVLFLNVMTPLNEVHRVIDEGHESSLRVGELLDMLAQPIDPSYRAEQEASIDLKLGEPAIEFDNLVLDYVAADGRAKRCLDGISWRIDHGQTIGVAGPSGSGKSTWIKALLRLVHPSGGGIRLGGVPLDRIGRRDLARVIAYVGQNPFVFSGSVRDNIAYGNGAISGEQIQHAAELANILEEIREMPDGFESAVFERGQNVSGGQRQRLALARILVKHAPILILDEATSALDNLSERHVQQSLGIRNGYRTTIIIAHRLSTLQDCDCILVFDHGRIVEAGPYDELMRRRGLFAELVASGEHAVSKNGYG